MLAVTQSVQRALSSGSDAWHLQLDKLCFKRGGDATAKTESIKEVLRTYRKHAKGSLIEACRSKARILNALEHQHRERFAAVRLFADSPLLLHLGRANVLENVGIFADRTTGLPIIPGTALKGVLSTWACWEANQMADGAFREGGAFMRQRLRFPSPLAHRVFGDDATSGSERIGDVVFLGGFPTKPPTLGLDIVNPHHEPDGRDKATLTPNVFLCIEPGSEWCFAFYVRTNSDDAQTILNATHDWLIQALTQLGIGAKTAAGYGRFRMATPLDLAARANDGEHHKTAQALEVERAKYDAQVALARAALTSDYPTSAVFKNRVLDRLNPGQLEGLQAEIDVLRKPENASQFQELKKLLANREYKDVRKRLREKVWFPKEWLPPQ